MKVKVRAPGTEYPTCGERLGAHRWLLVASSLAAEPRLASLLHRALRQPASRSIFNLSAFGQSSANLVPPPSPPASCYLRMVG
ncbi:hypothetical protein CDV31_001845 [Fusarium ambrosium]|uniref:Uncharacterized protein n=1 Tax=Fusarium ambrosium TaxID=131363 RepID=A0A428UYU2_9HYPO|nr:hypothetical protein CDV31_001845 [Fusarium ambrosium]